MGRRQSLGCLVLGLGLVALSCATRTPARSARSAPPPAADLARADTLVSRGCYACLREAQGIYSTLRDRGYQPALTGPRLLKTMMLMAAREGELGLAEAPSLEQARALAAVVILPDGPLYLDVIGALPPAGGGRSTYRDGLRIEQFAAHRAHLNEWSERLLAAAPADPLAAYLLVGLTCSFSFAYSEDTAKQAAAAAGLHPEALGLRYRLANCRSPRDDASASTLADLLARAPRFAEVEFDLGQRALGDGRLLESERRLTTALDAFPTLVAAAVSLGEIATILEEFDRSLQFYERALALSGEHREALLGKTRALSYLGRHQEAIASADTMIALGTWFVGDAYYWRAWNLQQLRQSARAWSDVEAARRYLVNAQVLQLSGVLAYDRGDLDRARQDFEGVLERSEGACSAAYYLGRIHSDRRQWNEAAARFSQTETCCAKTARDIAQRVAEIQSSPATIERKTRLLAGQERQAAENRRTDMTAAYNAAVSFFNNGAMDLAARRAERVLDDEQWGERARDLIARARKTGLRLPVADLRFQRTP
jgi:tetratricopeptide (TPR) repeat protein